MEATNKVSRALPNEFKQTSRNTPFPRLSTTTTTTTTTATTKKNKKKLIPVVSPLIAAQKATETKTGHVFLFLSLASKEKQRSNSDRPDLEEYRTFRGRTPIFRLWILDRTFHASGVVGRTRDRICNSRRFEQAVLWADNSQQTQRLIITEQNLTNREYPDSERCQSHSYLIIHCRSHSHRSIHGASLCEMERKTPTAATPSHHKQTHKTSRIPFQITKHTAIFLGISSQ